jgi:4a-hydroxytetrahydrobiopterin dehydratase
MSNSTLSSSDTAERLANTAFVQVGGTLYGSYATEDFASASALVARVAEVADAMDHHPDIRLGYGKIDFELSSHDAGGVTMRDLALAEQIQGLADSLGATGKSVQPARYDLAIDTVDANGIRDFWQVGLGYEKRTTDDGTIDLIDPRGRGPSIWFQRMDPPRTDRNRIHVDVYVPTAEAEARVQAVLNVGGRLVTDEHAPAWWVLADREGNEICICPAGS